MTSPRKDIPREAYAEVLETHEEISYAERELEELRNKKALEKGKGQCTSGKGNEGSRRGESLTNGGTHFLYY
jgi:hypothetical protein